MKKCTLQKGVSLLEVVVGSAIVLLIVIGTTGTYRLVIRTSENTLSRTQAEYLLLEGVEAVRSIRDRSWNDIANLSTSTEYGLSFGGGAWATTTSPVLIDSVFERGFILEDVYRDGNDRIASSGTFDEGTRLLTVEVAWATRTSTTTATTSTYIANIFQ